MAGEERCEVVVISTQAGLAGTDGITSATPVRLPPPPSSASANAAALPYPVFFCSSALLGGRRTQNRNRISFLRRRPKNKKKTNHNFKTQGKIKSDASNSILCEEVDFLWAAFAPLGPLVRVRPPEGL